MEESKEKSVSMEKLKVGLLAAILAVRDALRSTVDAAVPAPVALENAVFKILN